MGSGMLLGLLKGPSSRSVKDSGAESYLNCRDLAEEVSEEKNINVLPRNHSYNIFGEESDCVLHLSKEFA